MQTEIFASNQKLKDSIPDINQFPSDKFPSFLTRIVRKLDNKASGFFKPEEEKQLEQMLGWSSSSLRNVLDSCAFIYEQAAYFGIPPNLLQNLLAKTAMSATKIGEFAQVWEQEASQLIAKLKNKGLVPLELQSVNWRLHLQVGQTSLSRLKEPTAIFELALKPSSGTSEEESVKMEFTHSELSEFFGKLETIQEQLDALG